MEPRDERRRLAEQARRICLETMRRACWAGGAFEAEVSTVAMLDLQTLRAHPE